jgi:pilus assembly protein CpaE
MDVSVQTRVGERLRRGSSRDTAKFFTQLMIPSKVFTLGMGKLTMLRGVIICPEQELGKDLSDALTATQRLVVVRILDHYPDGVDLARFLRAAAPEIVFLSVEAPREALELASRIEKQAPGTLIVAISRVCTPGTLLETMRAGIREFLASPFESDVVMEALGRMEQISERTPPSIESAHSVIAYLPAKAGVGASTIALNTSIMLSQLPDSKTLLVDLDLNCGMIAFMLQIDTPYSIVTAAENASQMDEDLWRKVVSSFGQLDVLTAGKLTPGFRIEVAQIRYLLEFARRNYQVIGIDLSGILEKFSIEVLHEATEVFLVCTPEIPSLHLAREKLRFLRSLDLGGRVKILLNRAQRNGSLISISEVEKLLQLPVYRSFPNDYIGVHKALTSGKHVNPASELGKGFRLLAEAIRGEQQPPEATKAGLLGMFRAHKKPAATPTPGVGMVTS